MNYHKHFSYTNKIKKIFSGQKLHKIRNELLQLRAIAKCTFRESSSHRRLHLVIDDEIIASPNVYLANFYETFKLTRKKLNTHQIGSQL